jgi:hypothetical protein
MLSPNGLKRDSTWLKSPTSSIDESIIISEPMLRSVQTMHLSSIEVVSISKRTETRFYMTHITSSSIVCVRNDFRACGTFGANSAPIWHRHQQCLQMDQNESPHDPRHLQVSSGACKMIFELWYVRRKLCTYHASTLALSPNGPKWVSTWASSPRSTIGCIKNDFWAYGTLAQTMHLSCTDTNVVPKWTEMRFHKTQVA